MDATATLLKENADLGLKDESVEEIAERVMHHFEDKQSNGEMIWAEKIGSVISI